jgi:DNA-binding NarL/FixJ family response regulator
VSTAVIEHALGAPPSPVPAETLPLTTRQVEILRLLASGRGTKQIAFDLGLSAKTAEAHRAQIMQRLQIRDLPRLVLYAVRHGLVSPEA